MLLALLVGGCSSSSDKPQSLPTLSPAATASASPLPVPPSALAATPRAADAFVRFFIAQVNRAFMTSNSALVKAYSLPICGTCAIYIKSLDYAQGAHLHLDGETFHVTDAAAAPLQARGTLVEVFGTVPQKRQLDAAGHVVDTVPPRGQFHLTVAVRRTGSGWKVSGIRVNDT